MRKKVLECEDSTRAFELKTVTIEQYAVKEMAEFERIGSTANGRVESYPSSLQGPLRGARHQLAQG